MCHDVPQNVARENTVAAAFSNTAAPLRARSTVERPPGRDAAAAEAVLGAGAVHAAAPGGAHGRGHRRAGLGPPRRRALRQHTRLSGSPSGNL